MKTCELCKSRWPDDAYFCGECGRKLSAPDEHIATVIREYTGEEEDEGQSRFAQFLPMPGSGPVQPGGGVPLVPGPMYIDQVPFTNTPPIPGPSAPGNVRPGGSPARQFTQPVQPLQPTPVPQVQVAPRHNTIPMQPVRHPRPGLLGHRHLRPTCLIVVVVFSILASTVIAIITLFPKTHSLTSPIAELIGAPILGKAMILHGGDFVPGETVTYTIDVKLSASTQGNALVGSANSMNALLLAPHSAKSPSLQSKTVESDGSFNATIFVDASWSAGSNHIVYVYNHDSKLIKALPFVVVVPLAQTGLVGCVNGADPILLGSISEGSNQQVSKAGTLCTTGSGPVNWTARWDQKWLQLNHSGQITAPQNGQVTFSASAKGLKPGSYTTGVIFSSRQSSVKVSLSVTFVVKKKPSPPQTPLSKIECVSATPQSLSFANIARQSSPLLQKVTISNCGDVGTWSASVATDNGQQWLGIDSSHGTLQSGGLQDVIIAASSANLQPGTYTGHVNFSIGSNNAGVQVIFTVRPPQTAPPCIHVNTQSLIFMGYAGQSGPSPQPVTLINCGATGHWAASIVTNDGANWLSINPTSRNLQAGGAQQVSVSVSSIPLLDKYGAYMGKITFAMGSSITTVNITFIVIPQCLVPGPSSLHFAITAGQDDPPPQSVTLANCGAAGEWLSSVSTQDGANWLSINRSSDHLKVGATQNVEIKVSGAQLKPGTYSGQVLFAMGASTHPVQVTFTVNPSNVGQCIDANPASLNFTSIQDQGNPDPQTVKISNCGSNPGTWSSAIFTDDSKPWIRIDLPGGGLKSGASQDVSIRLSTAGLSVGKHVGDITFSIGSSSKNVQITLTVQPQPPRACIRADQGSLTFTSTVASSSTATGKDSGPKSQTEGISNCGDAGSWSVPAPIVTDDGANWLTVKSASGSLQAGESRDVLIIVDSNGLEAGTYTATIPFKITVNAGATDTKNVRVTLTVSPPEPHVCKTNPSSLTFTSTWGKDLPAAQNVTLLNCGANDTWTGTDDSDTSLEVLPRGGNLDSKGSQVVSVRIDNLTTIPAKPYKYTMTFTTGNGDTVFVPVTWNLLPPANPACIQADTPSLSFSLTQGESTETSSNFTNCGAYPGTVSVESSTSSNDPSWLTVRSLDGSGSYPTGYGPGSLISLDSTSLASGKTYTGSIKATITTPQGSQASVTVSVTLSVQSSSSTPKPVVPAQSDTSTLVPTTSVTVTVVCESSCVVETSTVIPTDTSTSSPTDTSTAGGTPSDTLTPSPTDTSTPGGTPTDTSTPSPTDTSTPGGTPTDTSTPGGTASPTDTPTPTAVPTDTPTAAPPPTDTPTPQPTAPPPTDTPTPQPAAPTPGVTPTT